MAAVVCCTVLRVDAGACCMRAIMPLACSVYVILVCVWGVENGRVSRVSRALILCEIHQHTQYYTCSNSDVDRLIKLSTCYICYIVLSTYDRFAPRRPRKVRTRLNARLASREHKCEVEEVDLS